MVATPLVTNVVPGRQEPDRLLLLIHGKGADQHDLAPLVPHLDPEGRFLTIALKDQGFEVLLWLGAAGQAKAAPGIGTLFIESDDLRKDFAELKARGVAFLEPEPETYPFGMRVTALDPDGNPVALRQTRK